MVCNFTQKRSSVLLCALLHSLKDWCSFADLRLRCFALFCGLAFALFCADFADLRLHSFFCFFCADLEDLRLSSLALICALLRAFACFCERPRCLERLRCLGTPDDVPETFLSDDFGDVILHISREINSKIIYDG